MIHKLGATAFAVALALTVGAQLLPAQASSKRLVRVTVTDPLGRFVAGLGPENFEVLENGVSRVIGGFSGVDASISIAIVSDAPLTAVIGFNTADDELIQTQSVSAAMRQLSASNNARKALIVTTGTDTRAISQDIQVLQTTLDDLTKAVIELRNQYLLEFDAAAPSANVTVVVKQPRGLPPLRSKLKQ